MEASLHRELKQLSRRKLKAQEKGDLAEEAKLCNAVGELLSQYGYFEKAVKEHTKEVQLSEASQDSIGAAIAHRKVGECLCALKKYKQALFHQNLHLELARSAGSRVEEQRALATIGRTWFVHSDDAVSASEVEECLLESQKAYLKSLSVCDKLQEYVSEKELLEMRSRLYLNLGLTYDCQNDSSRAKSFMEKALIIARDQGLKDTEYRCLFSIGSIHMKSDADAHALRSFEQALLVARNGNKKFDEADALNMLGKIFLKLGEFSAGRQNLKKAYLINKAKRSDEMEEIKSNLATAIKGIRFQRKHVKLLEYPLDEQLKILDTLGDLYCKAKAYQKALGCYKKELELAKLAGKSHKKLSPIYVSLAITYFDLKCPADAINCYMEELEIMEEDNYKEMCDTWCNIAYVHEKAGQDYDEIKDAYNRALGYAEQSGKPSSVLRVWKCLADTQKIFDLKDDWKKSLDKVAELESQFVIGEEFAGDDDEERNSTEDDDEMTEDLIEKELLLSDSDEDSDDEEGARKRNNPVSSRLRRKQRKLVNEKGETPLHEAAIAGNTQRVKSLLEKGADVNARDYCGWLPLHEACNHGHTEIVELLLMAGSNANDQSGEHCSGVTPLHDAALNGHIDVVKILLSHGASINLKDIKGQTALDAVVAALKGNVDKDDDEYTNGRKRVVKFLRKCLEKKDCSELRRRNVIHDEDDELEDDGETASSTLQRFNEKLKKKEEDRLKRINNNLFEENRPKDEEICQTRRFSQQRTFVNENDDDSQEGFSIFSFSTNPSSEIENLSYSDGPVNQSTGLKNISRDHGEDFQTFSYASDHEGNDFEEEDSTYASTDSENTVEMAALADENNGNTFNSFYADPVTGVRTSCNPSGLLPEKTAAWLVDDVGPRPAKRKRPAKQTKLISETTGQRRSTSAMPRLPVNQKKSKPSAISRPSVSLNRSKHTQPKQAKLHVSKEPRTRQTASSSRSTTYNASTPVTVRPGVSYSPVTTVNSRTNSPEVATRPSMAQTPQAVTPPMRLRVRVQDKLFLIPCPRSNSQESKNIGWLAEQASLRYFSSFGLRPVLALKTSEGAFMSPEDKIVDVLSSNEEVVASVESWDLPTLSERYRDACMNTNTTTRPDVLSILEADPQLLSLTLSNKALQDVHVMPIFRAVMCHDILTKLMLPGNRIGDSGAQHLISAIPTLPSLAILDLASNGITQKGLSYIASALAARDSTRTDPQQNTTLQKLEEFNISYNWLGDSCGSSLAVILKGCPILNTLKLESCGLTGQLAAQGKEFALALKASHLIQLSVAYNTLGPVGIANLVMALPCESLRYLNLSSTMDEKGNQAAIQSLVEFMEVETCVLSDLILEDCYIDDKLLETLLKAKHMSTGLQNLNLSCNNIGKNGIPLLSRIIYESGSKLTSLILAGNRDIGTMDAATLLTAAKDSKTLQTLNLSACGVTSPLDVTFLDSLRIVASQNIGCLKQLDLCHNLLSDTDKQKLANEWHCSCSGESFACLENTLCMLTK